MCDLYKLLDECLKLHEELKRSAIETACRDYQRMRAVQDQIKEVLSVITEKVDESRHTILPELFKERGVNSIGVDGYRFTISQTVRASIPTDTKHEAYDWLRMNELSELIIETVNSSTLAAQAKKMMKDGDALPDDLFKVALVPNVSMTKI
jgi:hypothetical protein